MINRLKSLIKPVVLPILDWYYSTARAYQSKKEFRRNLKSELLSEALELSAKENRTPKEMQDYKRELNRSYISYNEFFWQYDFPRLSARERRKFLTRAQGRFIYYDIPWSIKNNFWHKEIFLKKFSRYVHRDWIIIEGGRISKQEYVDFMHKHDVICKQTDECCGVGIFKIEKGQLTDAELNQKFDEFGKSKILLEEAIHNGGGMEGISLKSLNTIRVVTVRNVNTREVIVFGAFFRMGRGNADIDNAHAGGLYAQINVNSGIIESEAISVDGDRFTRHPDTGFEITGFKIPRWEEIKDICLEAADVIPENLITGWDIVINQDNKIEIIEGNHGPDWDLMQSPLKKGVKKELQIALGKTIS